MSKWKSRTRKEILKAKRLVVARLAATTKEQHWAMLAYYATILAQYDGMLGETPR